MAGRGQRRGGKAGPQRRGCKRMAGRGQRRCGCQRCCKSGRRSPVHLVEIRQRQREVVGRMLAQYQQRQRQRPRLWALPVAVRNVHVERKRAHERGPVPGIAQQHRQQQRTVRARPARRTAVRRSTG
eukprot:143176-Chlamydomonas_euryale.AAC.3